MGERQYVAAQIDEDSPLYQDFSEYEESEGFESRSEAVRSLLRQGLDEEREDPFADRPSGALAGLLWESRQLRHQFVIAGLVAVMLSTLMTGWVSVGLSVLGLLYGVSVVVSLIDGALNNPILRRLADTERPVDVEVST